MGTLFILKGLLLYWKLPRLYLNREWQRQKFVQLKWFPKNAIEHSRARKCCCGLMLDSPLKKYFYHRRLFHEKVIYTWLLWYNRCKTGSFISFEVFTSPKKNSRTKNNSRTFSVYNVASSMPCWPPTSLRASISSVSRLIKTI